jgi:DNA-binding MarR family transcriptional regulator
MAVLAWMRLARVYQKVNRDTVVLLRQFGLSLAQFDVLAKVGAAEGMTQQELADALLVTKGNICQILDRMESAGWVVRQPDGRANRVSLTAVGRELFNRAVPAVENLVTGELGALTPEAQRQLLDQLRKLDRSLG